MVFLYSLPPSPNPSTNIVVCGRRESCLIADSHSLNNLESTRGDVDAIILAKDMPCLSFFCPFALSMSMDFARLLMSVLTPILDEHDEDSIDNLEGSRVMTEALQFEAPRLKTKTFLRKVRCRAGCIIKKQQQRSL